jgi:PAS domain S-box-containing protein
MSGDELNALRVRVAELENELAAARRAAGARAQTHEDLQAQTQAIVDMAVDGIITIDRHGIVHSFNTAAERIFGYQAVEIIGHNVNQLMPEPFSSEHDQYIANYIKTGENKIIGIGREVEGKRKDGSTFPLDLAVSEVKVGDRRLFTGIVRDITDRKRDEEKILESENFLQTVFDTEPECVKVLGPGGVLQTMNRAGLRMIEADSLEEVKGKCVYSLIAPEDRAAFRSLTERVLAGESSTLEFEIVGRAGTRRRLDTHAVPLHDPHGNITALLGITRDVTELKNAQDKLVQSERLAAMGQLLSAIAHESRNALQRIQAAVEMLQFEIEEGSESREDLARIERAKDDLQRLFEELRTYAAPVQLDQSTANLAGIWRQAWSHLGTLREGRQAELQEKTSDVDLNLSVDAFRIEQVFRNMIENALAACPDPVLIEITCQDSKIGGAPSVRISVSDNGPGFSQQQKQHVFEPFFTTKAKGTGLGMAIAQRIIEAHGGTISANDSDHRGAEFVITLPRSS